MFDSYWMWISPPARPLIPHLKAEAELFGRTIRVNYAKPAKPNMDINKPGTDQPIPILNFCLWHADILPLNCA